MITRCLSESRNATAPGGRSGAVKGARPAWADSCSACRQVVRVRTPATVLQPTPERRARTLVGSVLAQSVWTCARVSLAQRWRSPHGPRGMTALLGIGRAHNRPCISLIGCALPCKDGGGATDRCAQGLTG